MTISILGLGFVGSAMKQSFEEKNIDVLCYDKFKKIGNLEKCLESTIMFLCLPTKYNEKECNYELDAIYETCDFLKNMNYSGIVVIKSTVIPTTTYNLRKKYTNLNFIHNPEFLSAKTAYIDFHNQTHIVIGKTNENYKELEDFYKEHYPNANISICSSNESESMKIFCNTFYSVKIQFFNELYILCNKINCDYDTIKDLMIKNNWINPMHTDVPGNDGKLSYGGYCFPKDTNALLSFMIRNNSSCQILEACVRERNKMRDDNDNITLLNKTSNCYTNV